MSWDKSFADEKIHSYGMDEFIRLEPGAEYLYSELW
jgi:hypothetical protein